MTFTIIGGMLAAVVVDCFVLALFGVGRCDDIFHTVRGRRERLILSARRSRQDSRREYHRMTGVNTGLSTLCWLRGYPHPLNTMLEKADHQPADTDSSNVQIAEEAESILRLGGFLREVRKIFKKIISGIDKWRRVC